MKPLFFQGLFCMLPLLPVFILKKQLILTDGVSLCFVMRFVFIRYYQ